jgi:hypothetical protein
MAWSEVTAEGESWSIVWTVMMIIDRVEDASGLRDNPYWGR